MFVSKRQFSCLPTFVWAKLFPDWQKLKCTLLPDQGPQSRLDSPGPRPRKPTSGTSSGRQAVLLSSTHAVVSCLGDSGPILLKRRMLLVPKQAVFSLPFVYKDATVTTCKEVFAICAHHFRLITSHSIKKATALHLAPCASNQSASILALTFVSTGQCDILWRWHS